MNTFKDIQKEKHFMKDSLSGNGNDLKSAIINFRKYIFDNYLEG